MTGTYYSDWQDFRANEAYEQYRQSEDDELYQAREFALFLDNLSKRYQHAHCELKKLYRAWVRAVRDCVPDGLGSGFQDYGNVSTVLRQVVAGARLASAQCPGQVFQEVCYKIPVLH